MQKRLAFWKEAVWGFGARLMITPFAVLQFLTFIRDEFLQQYQDLHIINLLPRWSWEIWVITWLAILLVVVLEGSFRAVSKRDLKIETIERQIEELTAQIRPKLQAVCRAEYPWIQADKCNVDPYTRIAMEGILYTCRIGIINTGIARVRSVSVRMIKLSTMDSNSIDFSSLPCHLHFMNDNLEPYKETKDLPQTKDNQQRDALFIDVFKYWQFNGGTKRLAVYSIVPGVEMLIPASACTAELVIGSENGGETITASVGLVPSDDGPPHYKLMS